MSTSIYKPKADITQLGKVIYPAGKPVKLSQKLAAVFQNSLEFVAKDEKELEMQLNEIRGISDEAANSDAELEASGGANNSRRGRPPKV